MANPILTRLREPLPLTLVVIAALGWLAFIVVWIASSGTQSAADARIVELEATRTQLASQIEAHESATGTMERIEEEIGQLRVERDRLDAERFSIAADSEAAAARLAEIETELAARTTEREAAEAELATAAQSLAEANASLETARADITTSSTELTDVGARLAEARADEASVRETVAQLNQEAATGAAQVAELEARLQEAREAEADAQAQIAAAREAEAELAGTRTALETAVAELETRRAALAEEVASAETQREQVQTQVTELAEALAERGAQLADLETRITEAQATTSTMAAASEAGLVPGRYIAPVSAGRFLTAGFAADGSFTMAPGALPSVQDGATVSGTYTLDGDRLTLEAEEAPGASDAFPMICTIAPVPGGFSVAADGESCLLGGLTLERLN